METQKLLKSAHALIKDGHALNSYLGILQPISSSKPYILLSRNLMEGFLQHEDSEIAKSSHSHIQDSHALNSHLGILQTTSSKPYIP